MFTRKGGDLFMEKELLLSEALCGYKFIVTHLDNRQLMVASRPGEIVKPGDWKAVFDEGMPTAGRPFEKGRLFINFKIKFPASGDLSDVEVEQIASILPAPPALPDLVSEWSGRGDIFCPGPPTRPLHQLVAAFLFFSTCDN